MNPLETASEAILQEFEDIVGDWWTEIGNGIRNSLPGLLPNPIAFLAGVFGSILEATTNASTRILRLPFTGAISVGTELLQELIVDRTKVIPLAAAGEAAAKALGDSMNAVSGTVGSTSLRIALILRKVIKLWEWLKGLRKFGFFMRIVEAVIKFGLHLAFVVAGITCLFLLAELVDRLPAELEKAALGQKKLRRQVTILSSTKLKSRQSTRSIGDRKLNLRTPHR